MTKETSSSPIALHIEQVQTSLDIMALYNLVEQGLDYILLDSSKKDSPYSHYSIIGVHPFLSLKYEHKKIYVKGAYDKEFKVLSKDTASLAFMNLNPLELVEPEKEDVFSFLNALLQYYKVDNPSQLPFIGGGLGYFGYDLSKELENIPSTAKKDLDIPDAYFVFYDNYLILDLKTQELTITGLNLLEDSQRSVQKLKEKIQKFESEPVNDKLQDAITQDHHQTLGPYKSDFHKLTFTSPFTKSTYMDAVESMRQYIKEGHIYIANMTHTFKSFFYEEPKATYDYLRTINPAPFSAYMPLDGFSVLSSSPERFLDIRGRKVQTRPIKGTMPRGKTPEEDLKNKNILIHSEKDKSELLMIVDLERNDLSKVCLPGSVKVTELFEIETYATVFHLVSTIEGRLSPAYTSVDCIKAAFPGGSITGAPKIRAMEIIEELEANRRNIYTGSIGYLGFDGNADFNIVIRTIVLKDQTAYIGVGGGITWESDLESEYKETLDKGNALFKTLESMSKANLFL